MEHNNGTCGCNHLEGVTCDVENCVYNNGQHFCTAKSITVKSCNAMLGDETKCGTFKEKM